MPAIIADNFDWIAFTVGSALAVCGAWIVLRTGDPDIALRAGSIPTYWAGSVEIPLRVRDQTPWPSLEEWNAAQREPRRSPAP
jgi:hypothetical protein